MLHNHTLSTDISFLPPVQATGHFDTSTCLSLDLLQNKIISISRSVRSFPLSCNTPSRSNLPSTGYFPNLTKSRTCGGRCLGQAHHTIWAHSLETLVRRHFFTPCNKGAVSIQAKWMISSSRQTRARFRMASIPHSTGHSRTAKPRTPLPALRPLSPTSPSRTLHRHIRPLDPTIPSLTLSRRTINSRIMVRVHFLSAHKRIKFLLSSSDLILQHHTHAAAPSVTAMQIDSSQPPAYLNLPLSACQLREHRDRQS